MESQRKAMRLLEFRCAKCGRLLGRIDGSAEIKCPRCGELNTIKSPAKSARLKITERHRTPISLRDRFIGVFFRQRRRYMFRATGREA